MRINLADPMQKPYICTIRIRLYYSMQKIDFIIHHTTFTKHLNKGTYYLGKYLFLKEPVLTVIVKYMSDLDLATMLLKNRINFNKNKPLNSLTKPVLVTNVNNSNKTELLPFLAKCV